MRSLSRTLACVAVALLVVLQASVAFAQARTVVGIGPGLFFEDSEYAGEEQTSVEVVPEDYVYVSDGVLNGQLYFLAAFTDRIRIGGGISYHGKYIAEKVPEEELEEDEEPETFEFGTLLEIRSRGEYLIPTGETFDIALGAAIGIPILFPDGDLKQEIESLQDQQASVWSLPRIGFLAGPYASAIYHYSEYLSFRFDLGVYWERIFIYSTTEEVQGIPFRKSGTAKILKTEAALLLEVKL